MPTFAAPLAIGWLPEDWTIGTTYLVCAVLAGTVIVVQLVLGLVGIGGADADVDTDGADGGHDGHDGHDGLPLLSVRAISSAIVMFGLLGLTGTQNGWGQNATLAIASLGALTVLFLVAYAMKLQTKLDSSGTVDASAAVGTVARVYLRIPEQDSGRGKITVEIQGRTAEYEAFTLGPAIATGAPVDVLRLAAPALFEVRPAKESK